jgi:hypothetical protein
MITAKIRINSNKTKNESIGLLLFFFGVMRLPAVFKSVFIPRITQERQQEQINRNKKTKLKL